MLLIGPIRSILHCSKMAGFVESLLTQTLIIHIIRTAKIPFLESRASTALITTTIIIAVIGITLPFSWLGGFLGFVRYLRLIGSRSVLSS